MFGKFGYSSVNNSTLYSIKRFLLNYICYNLGTINCTLTTPVARDLRRNQDANHRRTRPSDCGLRITQTKRFLIRSHQCGARISEEGDWRITDKVARVDVVLVPELVGAHVISDL